MKLSFLSLALPHVFAAPRGLRAIDKDHDTNVERRLMMGMGMGPTLTYIGENEPVYEVCEGDCDSSRDCDWGLNCFERDNTEAVPGCGGDGISGRDYCYVPPPGELVLAGNNNSPASAFPLQECQADCDDDADCDFGLVCLQRDADEAVPGCTGEGLSTEDYCVVPPEGTLVLMSDSNGLGVCEGSCDSNADCEGTLLCFARDELEEVPGCGGVGAFGRNYCYEPIVADPTPNPSGIPSATPTASPTNVPTVEPSESPSPKPSENPTKSPTSTPTESPTSAPPTPAPTSAPSPSPSSAPTTSSQPTKAPVTDTDSPSTAPSPSPTDSPSAQPTKAPVTDTDSPSTAPSPSPTDSPSAQPTKAPMTDTDSPSAAPSPSPTDSPSSAPSRSPTDAPSLAPSRSPTNRPTLNPSRSPSASPTETPSKQPTLVPSVSPSQNPVESSLSLELVGNNGSPAAAFPLQECQADCDGDNECDWGLICFERDDEEPVPGCTGSGFPTEDFCIRAPAGHVVEMGNDGVPAENFPLSVCEGDCDDDTDCEGSLECFQRDDEEAVPGCTGTGRRFVDFCYDPNSPTPSPVVTPTPNPVESGPALQLVGNNGSPSAAFPLQECQADCDGDDECAWGLICFERDAEEPVPGCTGSGFPTEDFCIRAPAGHVVEMGNDGVPAENFPLGICEGDCDNDNDCEGSLECFQRDGEEAVPGCSGIGRSFVDFCYDPTAPSPTLSPITFQTFPPVDGSITYVPGEATVEENGLLLSTGLTSRIIATKDTRVRYDTGGQSEDVFHTAPDGGAVFKDTNTGGWIYVSNSESSSQGGVGAITFDSEGRVVEYKRLLSGTRRNCGGGKSFWNTWITCEEVDDGQVWEVDPRGVETPRQTLMGNGGMNYESAAYDNRDVNNPKFFLTVDETNGPLVRFSPDPSAVATAVASGDYRNLLHTDGPGVTYEYFVVTSINLVTGQGTYEWSTNLRDGEDSAEAYHVQGEGIDIRNGELFYTTKADHYLFTIDLDNGTFVRSSTISGAFDSQPDQVARVLDFTTGSTDGILYFCEDGGDDCGVHGRDSQGRFFTILQDAGANFSGETTGLAFSPDGIFMYVSFQSPGLIFEIRRTDGYPFQGERLDIKYHADSSNTSPFRHLFADNEKTCDLCSSMCMADGNSA